MNVRTAWLWNRFLLGWCFERWGITGVPDELRWMLHVYVGFLGVSIWRKRRRTVQELIEAHDARGRERMRKALSEPFFQPRRTPIAGEQADVKYVIGCDPAADDREA